MLLINNHVVMDLNANLGKKAFAACSVKHAFQIKLKVGVTGSILVR